jgi:predicted peptidase
MALPVPRYTSLVRLAALILAVFVVSGRHQVSPLESFAPHSFVAKDGATLPYRLLSPAPLESGVRYPLVLQLHGSGAIGTDNEAQIGAFSNGWLQPEIRKRFPAFVLVPQFPARTAEYPAVANGAALRSQPTKLLTDAYGLVDEVASAFPVDRSRIYVVGFSMGASAALQAIMAHPDRFAAAMAIAPVPPDTAGVPSAPVLILHGDHDTENPFTVSRAWFDEMTHRGARLEFRAYPGLQHELPPDVPQGTWWREWLFSKRRESKPVRDRDRLRDANNRRFDSSSAGSRQ